MAGQGGTSKQGRDPVAA